LAGAEPARQALGAQRPPIDPRRFDRADPDTEFLILDADSSQQAVVEAALSGQNGVIQGPPGTGKSQTIVNLIASLAARGQRVLFVADKRAAIEVVLKRLEQVGLGHLALDLHDAERSRRAVIRRFADSLLTVREAQPVSSGAVHARLADRRQRLADHAERMHVARPPSGLSFYQIQSELLRLPGHVRASTRWRDQALARIDQAAAGAIRDALREAGSRPALFLGQDPSPWATANPADGASVLAALDSATGLARIHWPVLRQMLDALAGAGVPAPASLDHAAALVGAVADLHAAAPAYRPDIGAQNLAALIADLAPAGRGALRAGLTRWFDPAYRAALAYARSLRAAGPAPPAQLLAEITAIAGALDRWSQLAPGWPAPIHAGDPAPLARQLAGVSGDLRQLAGVLERPDLFGLPLAEVERLLQQLAADPLTAQRMVRVAELRQAVARHGAADLVDELRRSSADPADWAACFDYAWLASCLDDVRAGDSLIAGFSGATHSACAAEFAALDHERLALGAARVRRAHAERAIASMNAHPDQAGLVRREAEKRTRHMSLRSLLAQAPAALTALRPCWMASPPLVSQLLGADQRYFDVVIFDEASQVLPHDAIPALLRGSRLIVAGDKHQLPPTTFFATGDEEADEEPAPTQGFESLLDLMNGFLEPWTLNWHYRSRDEALIAFSNRHIYGNRLVTFPGPGGPPALSHILAPSLPGVDQSENASLEVRRVLELVLDHARVRPDLTLGVITMGLRHADLIEAALEAALRQSPGLDPFFDPLRPERFFIKNLERVQGDERDVIILSVGYGKQSDGRLLYRFGPLLNQGGERRLNVAVTRARQRMLVVSSFTHHDMPPERSKARGVELLRAYLEYAAGQGGGAEAAARADIASPVLADIQAALARHGLDVRAGWGASAFPIDLAVLHPRDPDRCVLAIETDGPTYAAIPTVRERDRLRVQQLRGLGWTLERLWLLDWFDRREQQIARILAAYHAAVERPAAPDSQPAAVTMRLTPPAGQPSPRAPRPPIPARASIAEYGDHELRLLIGWIASDGQLRTDDEIIGEMVRELGFSRRGARIESRLRGILRSS
ncbi:MAG TPA: AAA domain-containing protein, partial [Herpetosiphonaceae bacterium]|nr:AAA domain-containing protein [Herpetosiphonaceae bacterium]